MGQVIWAVAGLVLLLDSFSFFQLCQSFGPDLMAPTPTNRGSSTSWIRSVDPNLDS